MKRIIFAILIGICFISSSTGVFAAQTEKADAKQEYKKIDYTLLVDKDRPAPNGVIDAEDVAEIGMRALHRFFVEYYSIAEGCTVSLFYSPAPEPVKASSTTLNGRTMLGMPPDAPPEPAKWAGTIYIDGIQGQFLFSVLPESGALIGIEHMNGLASDKAALTHVTTGSDITAIMDLAKELAIKEQLIKDEINYVYIALLNINVFDFDTGITNRNDTVAVTICSVSGEKIRLMYRSFDRGLLYVVDRKVSFLVSPTVFN